MAYVKGTNPFGETLNWLDGITNGNDTIIGNAGADFIYAGGGNDLISGGGGADRIDGEEGRDAASYTESLHGVEVDLTTGKGKGGTAEGDTLISIEDLIGSAYNDTLIGNWQNNQLIGGDGSDILKGGGGFDILAGGRGTDVLELDSTQGQFHGGDGEDWAVFDTDQGMRIDLESETFETMQHYRHGWHRPHQDEYHQITGVENVHGSEYGDNISGDYADNLLNGGGGNDHLSGFYGNDALFGGTGDDTLKGGYGADTLHGEAGQDTFLYTQNTDSFMVGGKPCDRIMDFQQGADTIDLRPMDLAPENLYVIDGQTIDGDNCSYFGIDANYNGTLDIGEFAVAVKMAPGGTLVMSDFLL